MNKFFGGEHPLFLVRHFPRKLASRFVTSIVLGVSYGRRVRDLKTDAMVSYNHKAGLGWCFYTFQN